LAGLTVEKLAERLPKDARLGAKTLGKIERGERTVGEHEVQLIAKACGLPYEFFTTDLAELGRRVGALEQILDITDQVTGPGAESIRQQTALAVQEAVNEVHQRIAGIYDSRIAALEERLGDISDERGANDGP